MNVDFSNSVLPLMIAVSSAVFSANDAEPTLVRLSGRISPSRPQLRNALSLISFKPSGSVTLYRFLHSSNVCEPMIVTVDGRMTCSMSLFL